jgi:hypothetical protein
MFSSNQVLGRDRGDRNKSSSGPVRGGGELKSLTMAGRDSQSPIQTPHDGVGSVSCLILA